MAIDLSAVRDHPARIIREYAGDFVEEVTINGAAAHLEAYEAREGVTFAALDNDALEEVREEYAKVRDLACDMNYFGAQRLADAVNSLLGLDDA